ncbi:MAG: group II intron reverse transcriptase/maturase [Actinobacteria bacterium]|nr:group II intron reverse transcriptase/maturase [Actinomycetota bacterium]
MAKKHAGSPLTTLSHHLDLLWMREAYGRVRRDSAPGVDGQTVADYGENLDANLTSLLDRAKSGTYRAPLVKRVHIPKSETETRPLGMPTVENKVLERAVAMLLEPVYETEFLDCSFGFRPGRSPHQALDAVRAAVMAMGGGWVLDVDVRKYFDTIPHQKLRDVLSLRIRDGVIGRLVGKWLKAGIWEAGRVTYPEAGTPQGGVISPLLSNIYLHEVLDGWFERAIKPRLHGKAELIRFADDFVVVCERRGDAEALLEQVAARFQSYGLTIHPEKTRIVDFRHPWKSKCKPQTFDFLGFTHYWGKTRNGGYAVTRQTKGKKFRAALANIGEWCKEHRHESMEQQHRKLSEKVRGHMAYYGIRGNYPALARFRHEAQRLWHYWLQRRSRERTGGEGLWKLLDERFRLPLARIVHAATSPQLAWSL